jgi:hypothetical protein
LVLACEYAAISARFAGSCEFRPSIALIAAINSALSIIELVHRFLEAWLQGGYQPI